MKQFAGGTALLLLLLAFPLTASGAGIQGEKPAKMFQKVAETKITGGILHDRTQKNITNLFKQLNADTLKNVFRHKRKPWYAEPEFVGHYPGNSTGDLRGERLPERHPPSRNRMLCSVSSR